LTKREFIEQLRGARRQARELEQTFDRLLEAAETPGNDTEEWIDQEKPGGLGPRRHCAAVRRRLAENKPGAAKIGRRFLLSPAAYAEERGFMGQAQLARCVPALSETEEDAAYKALVASVESE